MPARTSRLYDDPLRAIAFIFLSKPILSLDGYTVDDFSHRGIVFQRVIVVNFENLIIVINISIICMRPPPLLNIMQPHLLGRFLTKGLEVFSKWNVQTPNYLYVATSYTTLIWER